MEQVPASSSSKGKRPLSPPPAQAQAQADDQDEASQAAQEQDEHYVTVRTDVVGVQYYRGMVGRGEYVMLRRQPDNHYDSNAVQVVNAAGSQVGHIPRLVASKLAPYMDASLFVVEGRMIGQNLDMAGHYKLALDLSIYAKPSHHATLDPELQWAYEAARARNPSPSKKDPRSKGKGRVLGIAGGSAPSEDPRLSQILKDLKSVEEDERQSGKVLDALTKEIDVSNFPLHPNPPGVSDGLLNTDLLPHQSQALQWMITRENPVLPISPGTDTQFWTMQTNTGSSYWLNVATRTPQKERPILGRGGILADGMGLGKTLTILSLVLETKRSGTVSGPTLIVCPLSVLSNWEKQVEEHIAPGQLSMYVYHGDHRSITKRSLEQYDIVLSTYQTVMADSQGSPSGSKKAKHSHAVLGEIDWKRIVGDEGHVLKNPKAKMTRAFSSLQSTLRWICTGTPIVNSPADLGSIVNCIRVCKPLDQVCSQLCIDYFKALLLRPLRSADPAASADAVKLLQALVAQVLLRRTKDTEDPSGRKLITLPPIESYRCPIRLDESTRALYDEIMEISRQQYRQMLDEGEMGVNVLSMLTRLRQLCLSADLVPKSFLTEMRAKGRSDHPARAVLNSEDETRLLNKLRQAVSDSEECPICCDMLDGDGPPCISFCGHPGCLSCLSSWLVKATTCPQCRHPISQSSLLELPPADSADAKEKSSAPTKRIVSAKITELLRLLRSLPSDEKSLVFSQFTGFLDHVALDLEAADFDFVRFDGKLTANKRREVIAAFQKPFGGPRIMLISLKAGAVGLNLTAASSIFLCDPWWQSAIESQAIDRAHRMGQTKTVRVFRLVAEDTIEDKVLEIQKRKNALIAKAFAKSDKSAREMRMEELRLIFS